MDKLILNNKFEADGKLQHEKEDLTNIVFEDLDFKNILQPISFFRSDFRGSKFKNVIFSNNNFDRADFIHCYFENVKFMNVEMGCCQMKNCYFKNCQFEYNIYKNTSIHLSNFENCTFNEEKFLINMQNCKLIKSSFRNCTFERSTTENDVFELCNFNIVDFATMHAEYHTFIGCDFIDTKFEYSYFFGYLIKNIKLEGIMFLYRGEIVNINVQNNNSSIYEQFICENRYFEALNYLVIMQKHNKIVQELENYLEKVSVQDKVFRKNELGNVFKAFTFYLQQDMISYKDIYACITFFVSYNWKKFSTIEALEYMSKVHFLENLFVEIDHDISFLKTIPQNEKSLIELTFGTDDFDEAISKSIIFFEMIGCTSFDNYKLLEKKKGSWVLVYALATAGLVSVLPKAIKTYYDMYWEIRIKSMARKKTLQLLSNAKDIKQIDKILSISDSHQLGNVSIPSLKESVVGLESIKINI